MNEAPSLKQEHAGKWIDHLAQAWRTAHRGLDIQAPAAHSDAELTLNLARATALDCQGIPNGKTLSLRIVSSQRHPVMIENLPQAATVLMDFKEYERLPGSRNDVLRLAPTSEGRVCVIGPSWPLKVTAGGDAAACLVVEQANVIINDELPESVGVEIRDGTVTLEKSRATLTLAGSAKLSFTGQSKLSTLHVRGESELWVSNQVRFTKVAGSSPEQDRLRLRLDSGVLRTESHVRVVQDLTLRIDLPGSVIGIAEVSNLVAEGRCPVSFDAQAVGANIRCVEASGEVPKLTLGDGASISGVVGECELVKAKHASLSGGPEGITIRKFGDESERPAEGLFLINFKLPAGMAGRKVLAVLQDAYHVDPDASAVPGWEYRLFSRAGWHKRSDEDKSRILNEREYVRELARLANDKGAPGSTRSKIAWCAYRLRHMTTQSRSEYASLLVYRMLGYGERPLPCFGLWVLLSVLATALAFQFDPDWTCQGVFRFARELGLQATGPFAGIMRSGTPAANHEWEYVVRAAVAAPLITGLIALRNYVKSSK